MLCKIYKIIYLSGLTMLVACGQQHNNTLQPAGTPGKDALIEVNKQLAEKDKDIIEAFIKRKNWDMHLYSNGYYGMIIEEGKGALAADGTLIELRCTIKLLDGTVCYENQTHEFVVGKSVEIAGLHHAATLLRKSAKARFIFPPHLAYGLAGDRNKVGARSILLYEVEVINITSD